MVKYKKILLATDYSDQAKKALVEAVRLARRDDAELHVLYVEVIALQGVGLYVDPQLPGYVRDMRQVSMGAGQDVALNYAKSFPRVVRDRSEAAGILRYAAAHEIDLIVLGTHGRGMVPELIMGSVAQTVVRESPVSVLVVGPHAGPLHTRCVLAPVDFSAKSAASLSQAGRLAAAHEARLVVLNVVDFNRVQHPEELEIGEREERARPQLARFIAEAALPVKVDTRVAVGPAADTIIRIAAEQEAGLIAMGASGHNAFQRLMLGSVCRAVVRGAPCPVLIHREAGTAAQARVAA